MKQRWKILMYGLGIIFLKITDVQTQLRTEEFSEDTTSFTTLTFPHSPTSSLHKSNPEEKCRTVSFNQPYYCSKERFATFAFKTCYVTIDWSNLTFPEFPTIQFSQDKEDCEVIVVKMLNSTTYERLDSFDFDPKNKTGFVFQKFKTEKVAEKWVQCCEAAIKCCDQMLNDGPPKPANEFCPRTWDGWQCFRDTPANSSATEVCESQVYIFADLPKCPQYVAKNCLAGGKWQSYSPNAPGEWTNYTTCHNVDEKINQQILTIVCYSVSIAFLLPAIIIFSSYKQLRVHRTTLHKNLFLALFFNCIMFIIFKAVFIIPEIDKSSVIQDKSESCKAVYMMSKYTRTTTYLWMFCEGFYLHKLIVAAFAEQKNLIIYYLIGWVFPVIPIIIYSITRYFISNDTCWISPFESLEWIINGPNLFSLVLNFVFLCNIIRVLVTKLRATHSNEPSQYRKAVKATLVLIPLFGLHILLTIYRPVNMPCGLWTAYNITNSLLDGLQGTAVAIIFCYLNSEVLYLLKRSYKRLRLRYGVKTEVRRHFSTSTQVMSVSDSPSGRKDSRSQALELETRKASATNA